MAIQSRVAFRVLRRDSSVARSEQGCAGVAVDGLVLLGGLPDGLEAVLGWAFTEERNRLRLDMLGEALVDQFVHSTFVGTLVHDLFRN
jgi:hypothetical protein